MIAPPLSLPRTLSEAEAQALHKFQAWLAQTMPGQVERLILFGSKARGDAHAEPDIDVFLVLRDATPERRESVRDFTVDLMVKDEPEGTDDAAE
jgi:predicted nucleotidyltransferase